ncbi:MAG: hypothetical protein L0G23_01025, partial [Ruaniaceae bacterium]|nr:hypothetical protein [Ruaniaceae bacterium]
MARAESPVQGSSGDDEPLHGLAEQDDNMLHKPYNQFEAAGLYREIKQLMAEDAARRKAATQFSSENQPGDDGPGKFPGPSGALGDARELAVELTDEQFENVLAPVESTRH